MRFLQVDLTSLTDYMDKMVFLSVFREACRNPKLRWTECIVATETHLFV